MRKLQNIKSKKKHNLSPPLIWKVDLKNVCSFIAGKKQAIQVFALQQNFWHAFFSSIIGTIDFVFWWIISLMLYFFNKPVPMSRWPVLKLRWGSFWRFRTPLLMRPGNLGMSFTQSAGFNPSLGKFNVPVLRFTPGSLGSTSFPPVMNLGRCTPTFGAWKSIY